MLKRITLSLMIAGAVILMAGCGKEEGPAEGAGKSLDEAAKSAEKSANDAAKAIDDKLKK